MLKYVYMLVFMGIALSSSAQNFLIREDFENLSGKKPPSGWTNLTISGDTTVDAFFFQTKIYHLGPPIHNDFAIFDAYNGGSIGGTATNNRAEDVVLVLPTLNTSGLNNLNLRMAKQSYLQYGASVSIDISADTGKTWSMIWADSNNVVDGAPVLIDLSLNSYTGKSSLMFRLHWKNRTTATYRGFFAFDDLEIFEKKNYDVLPVAMDRMYNNACPDTKQPLEIVVSNTGVFNATNVPVTVRSGTFVTRDTIASLLGGATKTIVMPDSLNTSSGGVFNFEIFTAWGKDNAVSNDTIRLQRTSSVPPRDPEPGGEDRCGVGSVTLTSKRNSGDSTFWFDEAIQGKFLGSGSPFYSDIISKTTTFYCENARLNTNTVTSYAGLYRFNSTTSGPGSMFEVTAKHDLLIDSISQHFAYSGTYKMRVFVKSGTYKGSETSRNDWTELALFNDSFSVSGYGKFYTFGLAKPLRIAKGQTMAFYVDADASSITFTNGAMKFENSDLVLEGNTVLNNDFAGAYTSYHWNGIIHFRKSCSTERDSVKVKVTPRPKKVQLTKGANSNGLHSWGTKIRPDRVAKWNRIEYEIVPPDTFKNSQYGVGWKITNIDWSSENGISVPNSDVGFVPPSSSGPGVLIYKPGSSWEDSTVILKVNVLNNNSECDTQIVRYIYVAPTPLSNFKHDDVCFGDPVLFTSLAEVKNGFLSYNWDFGDGKSSTVFNPSHNYAKYGTYNVKLTVITDQGITDDTTMVVRVYEIPDIDYTVVGACENDTVLFVNNTKISSGQVQYLWDLGDGTKSSDSDPGHVYATPGSYPVNLKASANGCESSLSKNANQFATPTADFDFEGVCSTDSFSFRNFSYIEFDEPVGATWHFGDGGISTKPEPKYRYKKGGTFSATLVAYSQLGCADSVTKNVEVLPSPDAFFVYDKACDIDPVSFANKSTEPVGVQVDYLWDFGDTSSSVLKNPRHNYPRVGKYNVQLKAKTTNGCYTVFAREIEIMPQVKADFEVRDGCAGLPVQFVNRSYVSRGKIDFTWYFGDGDSSDKLSPTHVYANQSTSTYNVILDAKVEKGCSDKRNVAVTIEEAPICTFKAEQSKTDRTIWTFTPDQDDYDPSYYTWIFEGGGTEVGVISPTYDFEFWETHYRVILSIKTDAGCVCIDSSTTIFTSWPTGIDEIPEKDVVVYPNPASDLLVVEGNTVSATIELMDARGSVINRFTATDRKTAIDVSSYARGPYWVRVITDKRSMVTKVILR